jgi:hypothetical protein
MSENASENENVSKPAPDAAMPKGGRKADSKAKPAKKAGRAKKASRAKKPARKPKTDGTNKKAEVLAMMKHPYSRSASRARGA